ncbi:hypothetical protein ACO2Q1_08335 [Brevundimonas sp. VNH65]|uniref:hypothetical protein n=1 Tax=Brevundimonas sp. VNH65 TaxID=3400917 RepID=UPI003C0B7AFA
MKGRILGVDADGSGVIVNDAGSRFRFGPTDWRGERRPAAGSAVDFEVRDDGARDIYPAISAISGLGAAVDLDAIRSSEAASRIQTLSRQQAAVPLAASALTVIAFFLPALSAPELSTTLFTLDKVPRLMASAGAVMGGDGGLGLVGSLLWLRFAAPLAAIGLVFMIVTGRPYGRVPLIAGVAAIFAGALPFLIKGAIISKLEASGYGAAMSGSVDALMDVGLGAWLCLLAGAAQIAAGLGVLKNPFAARSSN